MTTKRAWRAVEWTGLLSAAVLAAAGIANLGWDFWVYGPGGAHAGYFAGSAQIGVSSQSGSRGFLMSPAAAARQPLLWSSMLEGPSFWQVMAPSWLMPLPPLAFAALAHLRSRPRAAGAPLARALGPAC